MNLGDFAKFVCALCRRKSFRKCTLLTPTKIWCISHDHSLFFWHLWCCDEKWNRGMACDRNCMFGLSWASFARPNTMRSVEDAQVHRPTQDDAGEWLRAAPSLVHGFPKPHQHASPGFDSNTFHRPWTTNFLTDLSTAQVLDLDETLVHSSPKKLIRYDWQVTSETNFKKRPKGLNCVTLAGAQRALVREVRIHDCLSRGLAGAHTDGG